MVTACIYAVLLGTSTAFVLGLVRACYGRAALAKETVIQVIAWVVGFLFVLCVANALVLPFLIANAGS